MAVSTIKYLSTLLKSSYIYRTYIQLVFFFKKKYRSLDCHKDFVADVTCNENYSRAVSAGGDGTISIINLRQQKIMTTSDMFEDDQLSILLMKNGEKVVTGTQSGVLNIWSWGKVKEKFFFFF